MVFFMFQAKFRLWRPIFVDTRKLPGILDIQYANKRSQTQVHSPSTHPNVTPKFSAQAMDVES